MSKHPSIIDQETLVEITGFERPADIERELRNKNIRFFRGKRGIWTTVDAANEALGVGTDRPQEPLAF